MSYSKSNKYSWVRGKNLGFARGVAYRGSQLNTNYIQNNAENILRTVYSTRTLDQILNSPSFVFSLTKIINDIFNQFVQNYLSDKLPEGQETLVGRYELVPTWVYEERVNAGWDPNNLKTQMEESEWWRVPGLPDPRPPELIQKPQEKKKIVDVPTPRPGGYSYTPKAPDVKKETYTYVKPEPVYVEVDYDEVAEREAEVEFARVQQEEEPQDSEDIPYSSGSYVPYATDENEDWL